ncbi:3-ketoacyl-ACP reductase [Winogradskyella sp. PC-19]|uniref:carboxypeptidase-like regulatory domain-containing protein n=1 Tax=Winogradskyella sp. PC-19 TaxID=754417 RepID=UPI000B3D0275|nr:carboxypeptidase-like regulatory domain-containing protein [Winogradskyella sp. PC-19]ARV08237.1 3-ketoacyl-ACP reductase [Winogradskyella sp. PC-19]
MKTIFLTLSLLFGYSLFGQITAKIIDSETSQNIPYVNIWVENENIGTTSNEQGKFILNIDKPKQIILSAIGYKRLKLNSNLINDVIKLEPSTVMLQEVIVKARQNSKEIKVSDFKNKSTTSFGCGPVPWITARYFNYNKEYDEAPFIKTIKILTSSDVKNAKFNLRIHAVSKDGKPGNLITNENIYGIAKKGKRKTEVDVSHLNIQFPKKGFFLAFEWLIIEENKYEYKVNIRGSKKKQYAYEPSIGTVSNNSQYDAFIYSQGKWKTFNEMWQTNQTIKHNVIAAQLILSN